EGVFGIEFASLRHVSDIQARGAAVDIGSPVSHAFCNLRDYLPVVRLALLEGEFEADFVVDCTTLGKGLEQRFGLNAAPGVEFRSEGAVSTLVHQALLDVDDG